jgi:pyruvate/2-oxoglutarate dehydrogenase complex dihydrolipoamide dehydrogenase (E3) component
LSCSLEIDAMTLSQGNRIQLEPQDEYNLSLLGNVHPPTWVNPNPQAVYDVVVVGAGTAGLVTAKGVAGLGIGLKVALIEKHLMGGDCLNVGCVPSKCLIRSARVVAQMKEADAFGVRSPESIQVDFDRVMQRMRRIRAQISPVDSVEGAKKAGVDVFLGDGRFTGADTLEVAGQTLRFKKAVIATGARAVHPPLEGLAEAGFLTNETVFSLTQCPKRLAVIGGGPIGCELAQVFRRFGAEVFILERGDHLLPREDADAAEIVQQTFEREGIGLFFNCQLQRVEGTPNGKVISGIQGNTPLSITVDEILVGAGRAPNVEGLNLEAVGVEYDRKQGVKVNDCLQTTNPRIFAAGDICMNWKFTHAADAAARIVIKNMLFSPFGLGRSHLSQLVMPWATYTDPEVAHVGLYESEAREQGIAVETIQVSFEHVDRAIADGEEEGFVKIHYGKGGKILGATIVARHAGEMISEITTAIVNGVGLGELANVIHPYPTQANAIKQAADAYRRTLLTPRSRSLLKLLSRLA